MGMSIEEHKKQLIDYLKGLSICLCPTSTEYWKEHYNEIIFKDNVTIEAIPKADYENRLKADMVAMLTEIQLEIEEKFNDRPFSYNHHQRTEFYRDIDELIQQKINSLEEA